MMQRFTVARAPTASNGGRKALIRVLVLAAVAVVYFAARAAHAQTPPALAGLPPVDANGDGDITHAEAEAARAALFGRLDADGDGYLSEGERTIGGARLQVEGSADSDNRISRDEFMGQPYRMFDRLDINHDRVVSRAEMEAAAQAAQPPRPH
jgi:hypothetical protein